MQRQMYMLCNLVVVIYVMSVHICAQDNIVTQAPPATHLKTSPPDTTPTPITITFTCLNGLVTNFDISAGNYAKARVLKPTGGYCEQVKDDKAALLKCVTDSYTRKDDKVIIVYGDEVHNGVVGGQHMQYFSLSCTETSVVKTVTKSASVILTPTPKPKDFMHEISEVPVLSIKSLSASISVGESITLQMSIGDKYKLQPESCTAYRQIPDPKAYIFWNRCSNLDEAIVPSPARWEDWTDNNQPNGLKMDMFAFKFIGTTNLVIECRIKVCPLNEERQCQETCSAGRRRRRDSNLVKLENGVKTNTAAITLQVVDNHIGQQNGSQGLTSRWYITIIGLIIICWTSFRG